MDILWQHPNSEWVPLTHCDRLRCESIEYVMAKWDWDKLIWGKVRRLVFNLQKRIYKATKLGRYKKAKSLMYLLQNSYYATLLAVRAVTTENKGKRTAGVDRVKVNTPKRKMALVRDMLDTIHTGWDKYRPKPAKRIYIQKSFRGKSFRISTAKTFASEGGKSFRISTAKTFASEGGKSFRISTAKTFASEGGKSFRISTAKTFASEGGKSFRISTAKTFASEGGKSFRISTAKTFASEGGKSFRYRENFCL